MRKTKLERLQAKAEKALLRFFRESMKGASMEKEDELILAFTKAKSQMATAWEKIE